MIVMAGGGTPWDLAEAACQGMSRRSATGTNWPGGLLAGGVGEAGNDARGMMTMACHREFPSPINTRGWGM